MTAFWLAEADAFPDAARRAVLATLASRRDRRFRDPAAQGRFLRRVEAAWRRCQGAGHPTDRGLALHRVERVREAAAALAAALGGLDDDLRAQLADHVGLPRGDLSGATLQRIAGDLDALDGGAELLCDALRRGRGDYDRFPGATAFLIATAADAWRDAFGCEPSGRAGVSRP